MAPMQSEAPLTTRLLTVDGGRPRTENCGGQRLTTSLALRPVAGTRSADPLGLEGNQQVDRGVHGGRHKTNYAYLFAYTLSGSGEFGRPDRAPASMGENPILERAPNCPALSAAWREPPEERLRSAP